MGDTALYAVLPSHTAQAGITLASVGVLLSANRWIRLLTNGALGWAYDRLPRRRLFVPALFLGALSTSLYAFTDGFWPLLGGRLLWGLAWSGIWVGGNTILLDVAAPQDRGRWTGLYQLAFYLGGVLGFPTGGLLTDLVGYHAALTIAAAGTLLGAVVVLVWLPESRGYAQQTLVPAPIAVAASPGDSVAQAAATAPSTSPGPAVRPVPHVAPAVGSALRNWMAPVVMLYSTNRFVLAGIVSATLGLLVQARWEAWQAAVSRLAGTSLGTPGIATLTGLLLGLSTLISGLSAPLAGHRSDRAHSRWPVVAALLLPGVAGALLLAMGTPPFVLLGVPLMAVAAGSSQGLATTLLGDHAAPAQRGRALGAMHTLGDFSSALAPTLAYALLPWLGLPGLYLACAFLGLAMSAWAFRLGRVV